jgi:hypothetical protein
MKELMSNQLTTVADVLGDAHEAVQSSMLGLDFVATRQTKKGAVKRSKAGVMLSGNVVERAAGAAREFLELWCTGKRHTIVNELCRVFPTLEKEVISRNARVNETIADFPEYAEKLKLVSLAVASKHDVMALILLCQRLKGADKGEKLKLLNALRSVNEYELAVQATAESMVAKLNAPALEGATS